MHFSADAEKPLIHSCTKLCLLENREKFWLGLRLVPANNLWTYCRYFYISPLELSSYVAGRPLMQRSCAYVVNIPPKYSVAQVVGFIKGKSAIHIAREIEGRARVYAGQGFWARGYFVSTEGRDEKVIREYIESIM